MKNYIEYICGDKVIAYKTIGSNIELCDPKEKDAILFDFTKNKFITNYIIQNNKVIIRLANGKTKELENKPEILDAILERSKIQCLIMEQLVRNTKLSKPPELVHRENLESMHQISILTSYIAMAVTTNIIPLHMMVTGNKRLTSAIELALVAYLISIAPKIARKIVNLELIIDYAKYSFYFQYEEAINKYYEDKYGDQDFIPFNQIEKENILKLVYMSVKNDK